jgi:hypothetical protein
MVKKPGQMPGLLAFTGVGVLSKDTESGTGRETAGPSTTLRSGRDDNSVGPLAASGPCNKIVIPTGA